MQSGCRREEEYKVIASKVQGDFNWNKRLLLFQGELEQMHSHKLLHHQREAAAIIKKKELQPVLVAGLHLVMSLACGSVSLHVV
jgi:hypothetical protein